MPFILHIDYIITSLKNNHHCQKPDATRNDSVCNEGTYCDCEAGTRAIKSEVEYFIIITFIFILFNCDWMKI